MWDVQFCFGNTEEPENGNSMSIPIVMLACNGY